MWLPGAAPCCSMFGVVLNNSASTPNQLSDCGKNPPTFAPNTAELARLSLLKLTPLNAPTALGSNFPPNVYPPNAAKYPSVGCTTICSICVSAAGDEVPLFVVRSD